MTWKSAYVKVIRAKGYSVRFVPLRTNFGDIDTSTKEIRIDLHRNTHPTRTFLHEMLHKCYEEMPEKEVRYWEKEVWNNLSITQKLKLYKKLFQ